MLSVVQAPRASAILYGLLHGREDSRPWLLPANVCPIVPITFLKAGVRFELVDISATTLHMNLEQAVERLVTRRYGGVLYVHTYGEASTPQEFFRHAKALDDSLLIVDDRCLCVPELKPRAGSAADVQLFSTGYAKVVELGLGGYAFVREGVSYALPVLPFDGRAEAQVEAEYKQAIRDRLPFVYQDSDWLQTRAELPDWTAYAEQLVAALEASQRQRARLTAIYRQLLPLELQLPEPYQVWRFNIRVPAPDQVLAALFAAGLFASSHYASLGGIMADGRCPQAEALHATILNLFSDLHFDENRAEKACKVILGQLSRHVG